MADKTKLAVDAVVFTIRNNRLEILLIKRGNEPFKGFYALPGGMVEENENFLDATSRELYEETGVKNVFLKKFDIYGDTGRDPRGRVVSIAFIALISVERRMFESRDDAEFSKWFSVYELPKLAFDHKKIIEDALKQLRYEIQTTNIAFQILPKKFTLSELQRLYEQVLDKKLDKRNFRKRIKAFDILQATKEISMKGAHRPARLYKFKDQEYKPLKEKIHVFI